jgi:hypothetical protein
MPAIAAGLINTDDQLQVSESDSMLHCPFTTFMHSVAMQILTVSLSNDAMMLFGWRIAFLLGALTGVVGVLLRRQMPDPTVFLQRKHAIEEQLGMAVDTVPEDRSVVAAAFSRVLDRRTSGPIRPLTSAGRTTQAIILQRLTQACMACCGTLASSPSKCLG